MLLYPHLWVRKAAARLLGIALANSSIHSGLLGLAAAEEAGAAAGAAAAASGSSNSGSVSVSAGRCALLVYLQLEADVVDEGLCTQAVKCLVALAKHLAAAQPPEPEPEQQQAAANGNGAAAADVAAAAANGHAAADGAGSSGGGSESEDEDEDEEAAAADAADGADDVSGYAEPGGGGGVTLLGLISRMVRLAEDARFIRQQQRLAALRWIAAAVSAVGTAPLARHLPLLLRPLYRITEASGEARVRAQASKHGGLIATAAGGGGGVPEDVAAVADQVLGHLREQFGADTLLAAYASAREGVRAHRSARKTAAARRVLLDPEAAARLKVRRGKKKTQARHRKAEERRRVRSARTSGGFGPAKGSGAGKARGGVSKPAAGDGYGGGGGGRAHKKRGGG
jgi:U3 small nucleolar RNA-associated protein 20